VVSSPLATIFNKTLEEGRVPDDWKVANVTPICKKGKKADPGNYRPVSLTSVSCKLLESIIKDELMTHFESNKLINNSQHGFIPSRSCTTNLLEFFEVATEILDGNEPFDIIFLDFAKAFDKVPRRPLLAKLRAMGIEGLLLAWIEDWLTGRKQRVVLNGETSDWADVESGVPQGSILGPVLFVVEINDLDLVVQFINIVRKFADDTKLGQKASTQEQRDRLQAALDALSAWADTWGMSFNVKKCKVMHLGHNNLKQDYWMAGQKLETTDEERDIGITVTDNLKPSA
jgi:hypothetical protein